MQIVRFVGVGPAPNVREQLTVRQDLPVVLHEDRGQSVFDRDEMDIVRLDYYAMTAKVYLKVARAERVLVLRALGPRCVPQRHPDACEQFPHHKGLVTCLVSSDQELLENGVHWVLC